MNMRRTWAVTRKELVHIVRDPRSLGMALALPMLLLVLFGYALSLDVDQIPAVVWDQDRTPESRALLGKFEGSRYFRILGRADRYADIERALERGDALAGLVIPLHFARRVLGGEPVAVQLLLDGADSNTASIGLNYARGLIATYSNEVRVEFTVRQGAGEIKPPVEAQVRVMYNSDLKSRNYIIPGLIAVILMLIAAMLTSLTIAREWENGTMEELLSTPLRPSELVLGKLAAYFLLGLIDMTMAVLAGVAIFGVPLRGSPLLLFFSGCVFLFGALCLGLLLSAALKNQLEAFQFSLIASFLPAFMLSGFVYAIDNMPLIPRLISHIVPARYFVALMKGVFLKDVGLEVMWLELLLLAVYAALVFTLATRKLREKIA